MHQPSSQFESSALQNGGAQPRLRDDMTYQAVTIAAIVTILVSVWVF